MLNIECKKECPIYKTFCLTLTIKFIIMKNKILLVSATIVFLSIGCKKHDEDGMCSKHKHTTTTSTTTTPSNGKVEITNAEVNKTEVQK